MYFFLRCTQFLIRNYPNNKWFKFEIKSGKKLFTNLSPPSGIKGRSTLLTVNGMKVTKLLFKVICVKYKNY